MSIDGKIALKNNQSKWITSKYARQDVQNFRAKNQVLLSTSETILTDNSRLNIRYEEFNKKTLKYFSQKHFTNPIRVIIDSKNRITQSHKIIYTEGLIWLMRIIKDKKKWPKNVIQYTMPVYKNKIHILSVLQFLGTKEINNVWIEVGSTLSGFLLNEGLIDEVILYIAPKILGDQAKSLCILKNILKLSECLQFSFKKIDKIGPDIRIILKPYKKL